MQVAALLSYGRQPDIRLRLGDNKYAVRCQQGSVMDEAASGNPIFTVNELDEVKRSLAAT